jgi:hypothetical protein
VIHPDLYVAAALESGQEPSAEGFWQAQETAYRLRGRLSADRDADTDIAMSMQMLAAGAYDVVVLSLRSWLSTRALNWPLSLFSEKHNPPAALFELGLRFERADSKTFILCAFCPESARIHGDVKTFSEWWRGHIADHLADSLMRVNGLTISEPKRSKKERAHA